MITSNQDLWWTKSVNLGLKYLKSEGYNAAILLNDDVTVSDGFIDSMINMHIIKQDTIVISKIIDLDGKPWSMGGYVSWPFYGERHYISHQTSGSLKSEISWAPGMGTLIPLSVVEQIGYLNEREMPQYLSDADYGLRATKNGWKFFLNDECYIRNDTSSTGGVDGRQKIGLKELYFMLFNLRSPDYLRARFRFIYKHAPLGLRTISFVIRYTKLFIYFIKRSY
jgi:GT2 family glycosyltransferase